MQLLATLNEEGTTIVFVTHDPRMAEFAKRLIYIYDGKLANGDGSSSLTEAIDTTEHQPASSGENSA